MKSDSILLDCAQLIGTRHPEDDGWLLISGKRISAYGFGTPPPEIQEISHQIVDCSHYLLLPGFIDVHTHGAAGVDFIGSNSDGLQHVSQFLASHGVTGFLVTTWSASRQEIINTINTVKSIIGKEKGAAILGIHLEGPFINPTRAGAQSPKDIRPAEESEVIQYLDTGLIRQITIAPEMIENRWLISECSHRGIRVSAGHTDATYSDMLAAAELGVRQVTHTFNGMRGFTHREPGAVGAALEMPELSCELIADKIHVHPASIRLLVKAKGLQKVILVTDSTSGAGMPDGTFYIQGQKVVFSHGEARLKDGTLAGSLLTMDTALKNLVEVTGIPVEDCWICSSKNAAEAIGFIKSKGLIRAGMHADLVLLDSNLQVWKTIVQGKIVYEKR